MKGQILFTLFFFTAFCVATVFSQNDDKTLQIEFIRLNNLDIKNEKDVHKIGKAGIFLFDIIKPLLSKRGMVEIHKRENTLIITDTPGRVRLITELVKTLDNSGLSIDDLMSEISQDNEKIVTEIVKANNIFPITLCLTDADWARLQGILLIKPIYKIKVRIRSNDKNDNEVELIGTEKRVGLAKKIIALFDREFLTEEEIYDL